MRVVRLYDAERRPPHWTHLIVPGQYAAFSKLVGTSASCDPDGRPFARPEEAACLIFDNLDDAESFCRHKVLDASNVRFEIFDSSGRLNAPLLIAVHPARTPALEGNPRGIKIRNILAAVLAAAAFPLIWYDYMYTSGRLIFPTILAINLLIIAARLIQLNRSYAHAEAERARRLAEHRRAAKQQRATSGLG